MDSSGNYISIYIDYNPLLSILRAEIYCYKTQVRFLKRNKEDFRLKLTDYIIRLRYHYNIEAIEKIESFYLIVF